MCDEDTTYLFILYGERVQIKHNEIQKLKEMI